MQLDAELRAGTDPDLSELEEIPLTGTLFHQFLQEEVYGLESPYMYFAYKPGTAPPIITIVNDLVIIKLLANV
ncbi:hypothetical protein Hypma_013771 [Hypsizygus marmoreus]|uniref:Uncharacterized protein n=1 Tax=Hypsizygus marmoreus TaxID=39966 RepID=A0A369KBF4_HYPMA|nr:hypothetical protein Hypma_013771 [Hypsizygus marmoreus]